MQDIFDKPEDFEAFLRTLGEGLDKYPVDLFAFCVINTHWHLVLRPRGDGVIQQRVLEAGPQRFAVVSDEVDSIELESVLCCEHCGSESLLLTHEYEKRSWSELLHRDSKHSPRWYRESQEKDDIRFWDSAMGEGFSDWYAWYLKSGIESARETSESKTQAASVASSQETGTRQMQLI